jgi:phosphomannomutase
MSAHHYFRDFAYCDSGMIPWLLVAELVSTSGKSLGSWVESSFQNFPSSGEINFNVRDAEISIQNVLDKYTDKALQIDWTDGVSLSFENWRFNLRKSNTEPLVRLNIETFGLNVNLGDLLSDLSSLIKN